MYTLNTQKTDEQESIELEDISNEVIVAEIKQLSEKIKNSSSIKKSLIVEDEALSSLENIYEEKSPDPTDIYLKEIGAAPLLTKEEEVYYSRLALQGDTKAKNRMI